MARHYLKNIWYTMIQRCTNKSHPQWENYGGRGIGVCDRWLDYRAFVEDVGERPPGQFPSGHPVYWLDRIDNNKGYSRDNCRWATATEQAHNRRFASYEPSSAYGQQRSRGLCGRACCKNTPTDDRAYCQFHIDQAAKRVSNTKTAR